MIIILMHSLHQENKRSGNKGVCASVCGGECVCKCVCKSVWGGECVGECGLVCVWVSVGMCECG